MACCKWEFVVISDTTINAFVIPGGKVVVSTGAVSASDKFQCIDAFESADVVKGFRCVRELQMKVITLSGRFIHHWLLQQRRWKQGSHCGCLLVHVNILGCRSTHILSCAKFAVHHHENDCHRQLKLGVLWLNAGLLDVLGRNVDKLALILGRETAHVLCRHGAEKIGLSVWFGLMASMTSIAAHNNLCHAFQAVSLGPVNCAYPCCIDTLLSSVA